MDAPALPPQVNTALSRLAAAGFHAYVVGGAIRDLSCLDEADCSLLRSYFDHEQSLSRTSEYLYLHKNTLQYKLDRIHKICGLNPRSFRDGVILYLALRLKEM